MCRGKYCTAQHLVANLWIWCRLTCSGERTSGGLLPLEIWSSPERLEAPRLFHRVLTRDYQSPRSAEPESSRSIGGASIVRLHLRLYRRGSASATAPYGNRRT